MSNWENSPYEPTNVSMELIQVAPHTYYVTGPPGTPTDNDGFMSNAGVVITDEGVVILVGRTQTDEYSTFGIVIFEAESEAAARRVVENDPAVHEKVMRAELYPYKIALWRPPSS